jgi:N-ethylmaleimide reductase
MPSKLFDALALGPATLTNRMVMAPMTRGRAAPDGTPTDIMPTYYAQRATAGLIVTEATSISTQGRGWVNAPGIYTDAHVEGWKPVTQAVHDKGGKIFLQLWHMGRVSHPDFQEGGALPVAPSAIAAEGDAHTAEGHKPYVTPRALALDEMPGLVASYVDAAQRAMDAGFDGVELHGANGYLLDQFIRDSANQRTDAYGGSIENRWRLPLEVTAAVAEAIGPGKTAIRLSPVGAFNSMHDADPIASYGYGAEQLEALGLAYIHVAEARAGMMHNAEAPVVHPTIKAALKTTPMIINGGYDQASAEAAITEGVADAVAFGVPFLANPDLVARMREGREERNAPDFKTFYTPGPEGYIDYPALG